MGRKMTILGKKYHMLTIIKFIDRKKSGYAFECRCDCGKNIIINNISNLTHGSTRSCGCLKAKRGKEMLLKIHEKRTKLTDKEALINNIFYRYKRCSKVRKQDFTLTKIEISEMIFKNCFYCNSSPKHIYKNLFYNGIDRIDSSKGYINNNIVTCCDHCNYAKCDYTQEEFFMWINQLINYRKEIK